MCRQPLLGALENPFGAFSICAPSVVLALNPTASDGENVLLGVLAELLMEPFQIFIQTRLEFRDGHLIGAAGPSIGANALPRKRQVLA
jgi:hypothetical protein